MAKNTNEWKMGKGANARDSGYRLSIILQDDTWWLHSSDWATRSKAQSTYDPQRGYDDLREDFHGIKSRNAVKYAILFDFTQNKFTEWWLVNGEIKPYTPPEMRTERQIPCSTTKTALMRFYGNGGILKECVNTDTAELVQLKTMYSFYDKHPDTGIQTYARGIELFSAYLLPAISYWKPKANLLLTA
jgi:hypothetical protein